MNKPKPANFLAANDVAFRYVEKSNPQTSNLQFLTWGVYTLTGAVSSGALSHAEEEALLFCWRGSTIASLDGREFRLERYDVLYVPRGTPHRIKQDGGESKVIVCRAPADKQHHVFHASWKQFSQDEKRIRHLKGKDVFLMFDVSEPADNSSPVTRSSSRTNAHGHRTTTRTRRRFTFLQKAVARWKSMRTKKRKVSFALLAKATP